MDDPRELFVRNVRSKMGFNIVTSYTERIKENTLDTIFYVIADYIHHERETGVGKLERLFSFPVAFVNADDPYEWLRVNRKSDCELIMYVYDNIYNMTPGKHRRALLYLINMLHFDL